MAAEPTKNEVNTNQIDPGPWEIKIRDGSNFPLIGYAFSVQDSVPNQLYVYYVLESGELLPFQRDNDYLYVPCEMDNPSDPAEFYAWVEKHGGLGPNTEKYEVFERIDSWVP